MDAEIETLLRNGEGRYPTVEETRRMIAIAKSYERRLAACSALEAKEAIIAKRATELTMNKYPKFRERYLAEEKSARDMVLVLRYVAHAILRNDPDFLREKLLYWMQGVFASKGFGETTRSAYQYVRQVVAEELSGGDAEEVNRFVDVCIESCSRIQDTGGAS